MSGPAPATAKALEGLERAEAKLANAAARIAKMATALENPRDEVNLSEAIVDLLHARNSYQASLEALKTVNENQKHLIDVLG